MWVIIFLYLNVVNRVTQDECVSVLCIVTLYGVVEVY